MSVDWVGGTLKDAQVPGPSTYWIDAVVRLPETDHRSLRISALEVAAVPEDFYPQLRDRVPQVQYRTSTEVRNLFRYKAGEKVAVLADDGATVILSTKYQ